MYKSDGSQGSYPADARQGSKCWDLLQSLAGEKLWVGELSKFPLIHGNGNLPLGLGGTGGKVSRAQQPTAWKKSPPSSACHNETAALAITDASSFTAVISFLVQKKKKKSPFTTSKIKGIFCSLPLKGFPSKPQNHHYHFFTGNYSPQLI